MTMTTTRPVNFTNVPTLPGRREMSRYAVDTGGRTIGHAVLRSVGSRGGSWVAYCRGGMRAGFATRDAAAVAVLSRYADGAPQGGEW